MVFLSVYGRNYAPNIRKKLEKHITEEPKNILTLRLK